MYSNRLIKLFCLFSVAFEAFTDATIRNYLDQRGRKFLSNRQVDYTGVIYIARYHCWETKVGTCKIWYGTRDENNTFSGRWAHYDLTDEKKKISLHHFVIYNQTSDGFRADYPFVHSDYESSGTLEDLRSSIDRSVIPPVWKSRQGKYIVYHAGFETQVGGTSTDLYEVFGGVVLKANREQYYYDNADGKPRRYFKNFGKITTDPSEFTIRKNTSSTSMLCYGLSGVMDWSSCRVMLGRYHDHEGTKYDNARTACRLFNSVAKNEHVIMTAQEVGAAFMVLIKNADLWTVDFEPKSTVYDLKVFVDKMFRGINKRPTYDGLDSFGVIHSNDVTTTESETPDNLLKYIILTTASVGVKHNYDVYNSESERVFRFGNIDNSDAEFQAFSVNGNFASCVVIGSMKVVQGFNVLYGLYANIGGIYWESYRSCINDSEESDTVLYIKKKRMNGFDRFLVYKDQTSGVSFDIDSDSQSLNAYFLTKDSSVDLKVKKTVAPSIPEILVPLVNLSNDKYSFNFDGQNGDHPYYVEKNRLYDNLISLDDAVDKTNPFIPFEMRITRRPSLNFVCLGVSQAWLSPERIMLLFGVFSNGHTKWDNPEEACKDPLNPQQSQDLQVTVLSEELNIRIQYVDAHSKLRILVWTSETGGYLVFEHNDETLSSDYPEEIKATHIGVIHSGDFVNFVKVPVVGDMRRTIPVGALKDGDYPDMLMSGRYFRNIGNITSTIQDFTVTKLASTYVLGLGIGHVTVSLPYLLSAALSDGNQIYFEDLGETLSIPTHSSDVPATYLIRVQRVGDEIHAVVYLNGYRTKYFRVNDADTSEPFNIVVVMHHMDIGEVTTSIPAVNDQCVC